MNFKVMIRFLALILPLSFTSFSMSVKKDDASDKCMQQIQKHCNEGELESDKQTKECFEALSAECKASINSKNQKTMKLNSKFIKKWTKYAGSDKEANEGMEILKDLEDSGMLPEGTDIVIDED